MEAAAIESDGCTTDHIKSPRALRLAIGMVARGTSKERSALGRELQVRISAPQERNQRVSTLELHAHPSGPKHAGMRTYEE